MEVLLVAQIERVKNCKFFKAQMTLIIILGLFSFSYAQDSENSAMDDRESVGQSVVEKEATLIKMKKL